MRRQAEQLIRRIRERVRTWRRRFNRAFRIRRRRVAVQPLHPGVLAALWGCVLTLACLAVPMMIVHKPANVEAAHEWTHGAATRGAAAAVPQPNDHAAAGAEQPDELMVPVYMTALGRIEHIPLETYVLGVLAAEMPAEFELEALKAQALAARTYIIRRYVQQDFGDMAQPGAWVTDTEQHQVYLAEDAIAAKFGGGGGGGGDGGGKQAEQRLVKLREAVGQTRGQIIMYDNEPILAAFFSTSNGYTENSEDYWSSALPYLRSVESPWEEKLSPKFRTTVTYTSDEVAKRLGLRGAKASSLAMRVTKRSEGGRIMKAQVAGQSFTGRELREKLELGSTQFTWSASGGRVAITVTGSGHGVGMSQWGAQGMALQGSRAEDIIAHYYTGAVIRPISVL